MANFGQPAQTYNFDNTDHHFAYILYLLQLVRQPVQRQHRTEVWLRVAVLWAQSNRVCRSCSSSRSSPQIPVESEDWCRSRSQKSDLMTFWVYLMSWNHRCPHPHCLIPFAWRNHSYERKDECWCAWTLLRLACATGCGHQTRMNAPIRGSSRLTAQARCWWNVEWARSMNRFINCSVEERMQGGVPRTRSQCKRTGPYERTEWQTFVNWQSFLNALEHRPNQNKSTLFVFSALVSVSI